VLNAFINACSHRGAMLCRHKRANKSTYTCPFHGWTFSNAGKLLKVKDPRDAAIRTTSTKTFPRPDEVARFESYRAFCSAASVRMSCHWSNTLVKRRRLST